MRTTITLSHYTQTNNKHDWIGAIQGHFWASDRNGKSLFVRAYPMGGKQ